MKMLRILIVEGLIHRSARMKRRKSLE